MCLRTLLMKALLAFALTVGAAGRPPLPAEAATAEPQAKSDTDVFDEAWRLVQNKFYDRNLLGLDWEAVGNKHRGAYAEAKTDAERSAAINAMLDELGVSHTHHFIKEQPSYYQLVDIFSWPLRRDIPKYFSGGAVTYSGIGIFTKTIDGKTFISGVLAGLPADTAGLRVGDEIISADGSSFEPVGSFRGKEGEAVALAIRRDADGPVMTIAVRPQRIKPDDAFESAMRDSARIIEANGRRIGYIHVWSYAGRSYQEILEAALSDGKLKDADALIWDLRDGWGGARPSFLRIFDPHGPTMTLSERNGDTEMVGFRWRKPVVLLTNNGTRSGKEVLTYGFKKNGYGEVVGEPTAGALLAARAFLLSDGSLLILAVNDVTVDGERLEGKGVVPTIEVPFELPYAAGKDPQLNRAISVLSDGA
ncbi:MAG: S41 family peptidase [Hyphomicrobium sp.]